MSFYKITCVVVQLIGGRHFEVIVLGGSVHSRFEKPSSLTLTGFAWGGCGTRFIGYMIGAPGGEARKKSLQN